MTVKNQEFFKILEAAAAALIDARDPFSTEFLLEHDVSADNCMALSNMLGMLIEGYIKSPKWAQLAMLTVGALPKDMASIIWEESWKREAGERIARL